MGERRQPITECMALKAAWDARPEVVEFREHAEAFAWKHGLSFDVAGMNAMMKFNQEWFANHPVLPDSGILTG